MRRMNRKHIHTCAIENRFVIKFALYGGWTPIIHKARSSVIHKMPVKPETGSNGGGLNVYPHPLTAFDTYRNVMNASSAKNA